ncbi:MULTISPECIES: hypothetical protein [Streptomyces]|uniref:Uncharacterized protein n=1 Tax=Streptomyces zinciresistens K42 TaxID=700597 RepID=G2G612_9ACTN|nr:MULTISPECIES: hypothetical protein [Streptomyces]EGX61101.1 hypothetical protein SZN_04591 [Streptomyces zinciresistens K42]MDT9696623.1 hypothetical protein [Streptomyces sp. P17]
MAAPAILIGGLLLVAIFYDICRLIGTYQSRRPPLARLRGRRSALEAEERWCTGLLLHGHIDASSYRRRMSGLAHGQRVVDPRPRP